MLIYVLEYPEMNSFKNIACCSADFQILQDYNKNLEYKGNIDCRDINFDLSDLDMIFTIDYYIPEIDSFVDAGLYMPTYDEAKNYVNSKAAGNKNNWQIRGVAIIRKKE